MSSFNSGFNLGANMYNNAERNRLAAEELDLAKARDARAAEEFGWRRDQQLREDAAFNNFSNTAGGINQQGQQQLQQTYGMNPGQVARGLQNGGAAGLREQLAAYDAPDSYDLQGGGAGVQPRFTADQLQTKEPSRMDFERAMGGLALARRDVQGMRASQTAMADLQKSDIAAKVMAMKTEDLDRLAPDINQSGYPLLYTGKGKGGYTFMATEADGKTPIAGSQFKMNEAQLRQMALAHELGTAGFGTEAMATLAAAHKDIGDHVGKWNEAMAKLASTNNTATHFSNTDANDATRTKAIAARYNRPQAGDLREFQNEKGESVLVDVTGLKANKDGTLPLPLGLKPRTAKPEYTPKAYAETVKLYTETGMPLVDAQMQADRDYGRTAPGAGNQDSKLQGLNKAAGQKTTPQIIRQGETSFVDPSRPVRSPIEDFTRESERGMFGGVNYFYRDPLTNRKYSVDDYNKLLAQ